MKKLILLITVATTLLFACGNSFKEGANFRLQGKIGALNAPAKLYFSYMNGEEKIDSVVLADGKFSFEGFVDGPSAARLILDYTGEGMGKAHHAGNYYLMYIEKGVITLNSPDSLRNAATVNSPINDEFKAFLAAIGGPVQDISAKMNAKYAAASPEQQQDPAFMAALDKEFRGMLTARSDAQFEYARTHPHSFFSIVALSEASGTKVDVDKVEPLFNAIDPELRDTYDGKAFAMRIAASKNIGIGKPAPDFAQNTPSGQKVSLSDYRGRYVLLDFWASWCGPCRAESPTLVTAYAEYKSKGFDILGVSLDDKAGKDAWVAAIEKDGLTWTNISDLRGWNNEAAMMYGVRAVPQNYLIDPEGVIVAQNLRGEQLLDFLKENFK